MYYIYCYINNINGKKYVGQTNNLLRRKLEHKFYQPQENYPLRKKKELNHQEIINYIKNNSTKTNKQLADELNVSLSTIKRDKIKMKS